MYPSYSYPSCHTSFMRESYLAYAKPILHHYPSFYSYNIYSSLMLYFILILVSALTSFIHEREIAFKFILHPYPTFLLFSLFVHEINQKFLFSKVIFRPYLREILLQKVHFIFLSLLHLKVISYELNLKNGLNDRSSQLKSLFFHTYILEKYQK